MILSYYQDSKDVQSQPQHPYSFWKCPHLHQRLPVCRWWSSSLPRWNIYGRAASKHPRYLQCFLIVLELLNCKVVIWCSLLQAQMWTLCVGSTLVFGPILGKTWRLYRVFTQRVPDKRVVRMYSLLASCWSCLISANFMTFHSDFLCYPVFAVHIKHVSWPTQSHVTKGVIDTLAHMYEKQSNYADVFHRLFFTKEHLGEIMQTCNHLVINP